MEAIVEFDYKAQEPDELTIKKGDIINDIRKQPGGWWEGTLVKTGKRGMFPDNFVKVSCLDCLIFILEHNLPKYLTSEVRNL